MEERGLRRTKTAVLGAQAVDVTVLHSPSLFGGQTEEGVDAVKEFSVAVTTDKRCVRRNAQLSKTTTRERHNYWHAKKKTCT